MFRTIIIQQGEFLSIKNNWLEVVSNETTSRIPVEDVYCLVLDNVRTHFSAWVLNAITSNGGHVLICNEKHIPVTAVYPHNTHYKPYGILKRQLAMTEIMKRQLWKKVVATKLKAQAEVASICVGDNGTRAYLERLSNEVEPGDDGNREGLGAKLYFKALYGASFIRFNDDGINSALNYGYTILRSAVIKTLCAYGFHPVLGIHHINESNPFNLADDLMEPLRPLIDLWVYKNSEDIVDEFLRVEHRKSLINLVNIEVNYEGKKMKVRNALDRYIASFTSTLEKQDIELLKFPTIIDFKEI